MEKGADPHLTNAGGHTPPELLIMFINYGNIALTPNLLQVLNLLPALSQWTCPEKVQTSEGWQQLKKLVRIYCPFNSNPQHRVSIMETISPDAGQFLESSLSFNVTSKPWLKALLAFSVVVLSFSCHIHVPFQETLHCSLRKKKKTENSQLATSKSKSLHSSPTRLAAAKNNHVRFTPEIEEKLQDNEEGQGIQRIQRAYCRLLTIQELFQAMKQSPKRISISRRQQQTTNGIKNGI